MRYQVKVENEILVAVRQFLQSGLSGNDNPAAFGVLVALTSSLPLNNLDEWEKKIRAEFCGIESVVASSSDQWKFRRSPQGFTSLLDLCSADGYRRERILRTPAGNLPNGFFFALAVRRLNDWVPEVRAAARENLPRLAGCSNPEHIVDGLWSTLPHSNTWGRMGDAERQVLAEIISSEQVALALKLRIMRATAGPAPIILAQAGRSTALDQWLEEIARNAIQPAVRAKAYRSLLEGRMVWVTGRKWTWADLKWCKGQYDPVIGERPLSVSVPLLENLRLALSDSSPLVRRVGAELLIKHMASLGNEAIRLAREVASDRHSAIAERGRFVLAKLVGQS
jgi:hypothetical protein